MHQIQCTPPSRLIPTWKSLCAGIFFLLCCTHPARALVLFNPVGTAFTYQGMLNQSGSPADGSYDFQFSLYSLINGGTQQGATLTVNDQQVDKGRFSVNLDFGATPFANGDALWLEIAVRPGASTGAYTPLTPRQPIKAAPYAITALSALTAKTAPWSGITGIPANLADGDDNTTYSAGAGLKLAGTQFSVNFAIKNGISNYVARADHMHSDLISSASSNALFLHKIGPDTMTSSGTLPTLTVTQNAGGLAASFTNAGDIGLYASTTAAPHYVFLKPNQPILPPRILITPAALHGEALGGGNGVYGKTTAGNAIYGTSLSGNGIMGNSTANGSGGYFTGPTGVSGFGVGPTSMAAYFKADSGNALVADGSATVTQNLVVGGTLKANQLQVTQGITARSLTTTNDIMVPSVQYRDPRVHYLAIPPEAFTCGSKLTYSAGGLFAVTVAEAGFATMTASFSLPDGATITNVTLNYANGYVNHAMSAALVVSNRFGVTQATLASSQLLYAPGSSVWSSPVSANSTGSTVANTVYYYHIMVSSTWDSASLSLMRIYGGLITYTVQEAQ